MRKLGRMKVWATGLPMQPVKGHTIHSRDSDWEWILPMLIHGVIAVLALLLVCCSPSPAHGAEVPKACLHYRADLIRVSRFEFGMDAYVSDIAAQMAQESGCNPRAQSGVGAQGLAQAMPGTARDIGSRHADLRNVDAFNPAWAMRFLVAYDHDLWRMFSGRTECSHMGKTLAAYNSGPGWIMKMEKAARRQGKDAGQYFGVVELMDVGRSAAANRENIAYPRRIIFYWEAAFVEAGFGPGVEDEGSC